MLIIRQAQMERLQQEARRGVENRMLAHLTRYFPEAYTMMGERGVRDIIRYGIERANHYGIVAERNVCKYIDVMVVLGRDFNMDVTLPWAAEMLRDDTITDNKKRTDLLVKSAVVHAEKKEAQHVG